MLMRRIDPSILVFIMTGAVLLLALLGGGAGVVSFLLVKAGYSFLVWGLLPVLALLLVALVLGAGLWWAAGGAVPGARQQGSAEEKQHQGPRGGDDV